MQNDSKSHYKCVKYDHSVAFVSLKGNEMESCHRKKLGNSLKIGPASAVVGHLHLLAELQHLHLGLGELGLCLHQRLGRSQLYLDWHSHFRNLAVSVHLRNGEIDLNRQHHCDS